MNLPFDDDDYHLLTPTQLDIDFGLYAWHLQKWTYMYAIEHQHFHDLGNSQPYTRLHTYTDTTLCFGQAVRLTHFPGDEAPMEYDYRLMLAAHFAVKLGTMRGTMRGKPWVRIVKDRDQSTLGTDEDHQRRFHKLLMEWTAPKPSTTINNGNVRPSSSNRIS
jgi:hypothetical protein